MNPPLPHNMTVAFDGTIEVATMGWTFHLKTHGISLAVITLITIGTISFGVFALIEPGYHKLILGPRDSFSPTNLKDVLVALSVANLSDAVTNCQCETEGDRDQLVIGVAANDKGQPVLYWHDVNHDAASGS